MKIFKRSKQGFTLVELVVVIAVIAVLAAVSVGAYFGITETANLSSAQTHIRQLNDMLLYSKLLEHRGNDTFHEARLDVERQGLYITELKEFGNYKYAWYKDKDTDLDKFVLLDVSKVGDNGEAVIVYPKEELVSNKSELFLIAKTYQEIQNKPEFSYYLHDEIDINENTDLIVSSGIDTGYIQPRSITYTSSETESVVINTNYFKTKLTIDSDTATINHYGFSHLIELEAHNDSNYFENGIVGRMLISQQNKEINLNRYSEVFYLYGDQTKVNYEGNGKAYNISNTILNDCGSTHSSSKIVTDIHDVYDFCKSCGHALDSNKNTTDCSSIGYLYLINEDFNTGCEHNPKLTGEITIDGVNYPRETCQNGGCSFTYIPYETCIHNWVVGGDGYICDKCNDATDPLPKANVCRLDTPEEPCVITDPKFQWFALGGEDTGIYPYPLTLDTAFRFDSVDNANENGIYSTSYETYKDYYCDFVISFKRLNAQDYIIKDGQQIAVEPYTVGLWGTYFGWSIAFHTPIDILKDQRIPLLTTMVMAVTSGDVYFTYEFIVESVVSFTCGAFSCDPSANGVVLTVELGLWHPDTDPNAIMLGKAPDIKVGTWDHVFDENPSCIHNS